MSFSHLSHLECGRCGTGHDAGVPQNLCRACGSPLLARYDLAAVRSSLRPADLARRAPDLWRYHELLPIGRAQAVTTLGEGMTIARP